jgi:hypothetical protein
MWWMIWFALLSGCVAAYFLLRPESTEPANSWISYLPFVPLAASVVVRGLLGRKLDRPAAAFPVFIVGLALAEATVFMGIFLVPHWADGYFALGMLGMAQFVPVFLARNQV